jgi:hypothetical protein
VLPGAQILLKEYLCSREHKEVLFVLPILQYLGSKILQYLSSKVSGQDLCSKATFVLKYEYMHVIH